MVRCIPCRLLILSLSSYFVVEHRKHVVMANIPVAVYVQPLILVPIG